MCIYPEGTRNRTTEPLKNFMTVHSNLLWTQVMLLFLLLF
jgi:1-acyl-sn-glycerol-3-phosphate acyltransferase